MNLHGQDENFDCVELSDDELDEVSGGIPHFDNSFGGRPEVGSTRPILPVLQTRPTDDPGRWY